MNVKCWIHKQKIMKILTHDTNEFNDNLKYRTDLQLVCSTRTYKHSTDGKTGRYAKKIMSFCRDLCVWYLSIFPSYQLIIIILMSIFYSIEYHSTREILTWLASPSSPPYIHSTYIYMYKSIPRAEKKFVESIDIYI